MYQKIICRGGIIFKIQKILIVRFFFCLHLSTLDYLRRLSWPFLKAKVQFCCVQDKNLKKNAVILHFKLGK